MFHPFPASSALHADFPRFPAPLFTALFALLIQYNCCLPICCFICPSRRLPALPRAPVRRAVRAADVVVRPSRPVRLLQRGHPAGTDGGTAAQGHARGPLAQLRAVAGRLRPAEVRP